MKKFFACKQPKLYFGDLRLITGRQGLFEKVEYIQVIKIIQVQLANIKNRSKEMNKETMKKGSPIKNHCYRENPDNV